MSNDAPGNLEPWGVLAFENDTALDWIWELEDEKATFILSDCFAKVVETEAEEPIEAAAAEEALAAAEVLAALLGRGLPELPAEVRTYVQRLRHRRPDRAQVDLAIEAVQRVRESSELHAAWERRAGREQWRRAVEDLLARLKGKMLQS